MATPRRGEKVFEVYRLDTYSAAMRPRCCTCHSASAPIVVLLGVVLAWPLPAAAGVRVQAGAWGWPGYEPGTAFDLHFAREDVAIAYADDSTGDVLELTRVGFGFHERFTAGVRGSARIGGISVDQDDRPATEGLDLTGYYAEVGADGAWPTASRLRFGVDGHWRYTRVSRDRDDDTTVRLDWHSWELRSDLRMTLGTRIDLRLGGGVIAIDGNERVRDNGSSGTGFDADGATSAHAQLDFHTGTGGVIRLLLRRGNPEGVWLSFEHNY